MDEVLAGDWVLVLRWDVLARDPSSETGGKCSRYIGLIQEIAAPGNSENYADKEEI